MADCKNNSTDHTDNEVIITNLTATCASMLTCIVAVCAIFAMNLHKIMVYRLVLYQILSAILLGTVWITDTVVNGLFGHSGLSKTTFGFVVYMPFIHQLLSPRLFLTRGLSFICLFSPCFTRTRRS